MDILTALEASRSPLTVDELKEYCGPMYEEDRLDYLVRSGEIIPIEGVPDCYWSPPSHLKKSHSNKCVSPISRSDRTQLICQITDLRRRLISDSEECKQLLLKKSEFPTQEQVIKHMNRLHKYNDTKDIGLEVLGRISELTGVSVQDIYSDYGLSPED